MPTESTKNPSQTSDYFEREIRIGESLYKQALDHYKQVAIDRLSIQHSIIRNYLWLSVTILVTGITAFDRMLSTAETTASGIALLYGIALALISLIIGIKAMSGTQSFEPTNNYKEIFDYLTGHGYHEGNYYWNLRDAIVSAEEAISIERAHINRRGSAMRWMNRLLILSLSCCVFSALFYFVRITP